MYYYPRPRVIYRTDYTQVKSLRRRLARARRDLKELVMAVSSSADDADMPAQMQPKTPAQAAAEAVTGIGVTVDRSGVKRVRIAANETLALPSSEDAL